MNHATLEEKSTACCAEMEQTIRRNPGAAILATIGIGLAVGLVVRALLPEPTPRQKAVRLLEDIESRLREAATPVIGKAGALAQDGAESFHDVVESIESRLEHVLRDVNRRIRRLLS